MLIRNELDALKFSGDAVGISGALMIAGWWLGASVVLAALLAPVLKVNERGPRGAHLNVRIGSEP